MVPVPFSSDTFHGSYGRFKSDGSFQNSEATSENVKSSHIYLYSAFQNTDCIKAASQW